MRTWRGILMSMIMIVMSIWIGIGWIVVALQYISVRGWCRQRMISLEIKLVFVVMGFDLLLMLIINLTVFLVISGFSKWTLHCTYTNMFVWWWWLRIDPRKKNEKKLEKNVNIGALKKKLFSFAVLVHFNKTGF